MAEGILGLGSGQAASLNQEMIDKLKAAERKATVEPIETDLEEWDDELEKITEIKTQVLSLLESIKTFDLYYSGANQFEQMAATTTGTAATFSANDTSELNPGTTSITVNQLAQKDVYQTDTISDKTVQVDGGNDSGDMVTIQVSESPVYQTTTTSTDTSTDLVGAGTFTITLEDSTELTFTTDTDDTWDDLKDMINEQSDYVTATYTNNRLQISHVDGDETLTISDTSGSVITDLGLGRGRKFTTEGKTYEDLATDINANSKLAASIEQVGDSDYRLVIKSAETGTSNALTITQTGVDLGLGSVTSKSISDFSEYMTAGKLTINGTEVISDTEYMTYDELIDEINNYSGGGVYTATKDGDKINIKANDGTTISVVEEGSNGLNFVDANHTVTAQNMNATIDGVDYDTSSNTVNTQGDLSITAADVGDASITIARDTSAMQTSLETFVTAYNDLVDLVDAEMNSAESPIYDKTSLRTIMSNIKDKLFGDYGEDADKNIFSYGFDLDYDGHLSIDTTIFSTAITNNFEDLEALFIGDAENEGLGTQMKEYLDDLDGYEGALSNYDDSMTDRQETLTEEKEEAIEALDAKYLQLANQFAEYSAIITQMESQFSGLKMMIEQSTASS